MRAYYNENDAGAAAWLRELIRAGLIADGDVDERSIADVRAGDVRGYDQCHWFAGIGGWSYALRLAGWSDDRPVWTGSCPCQSFSAAGRQRGHDDPRNLWPEWLRIIREHKPATIFGEQVDAAIGFGWLDGVFVDLENEAYACGAAVLPAACEGAPHIRQRLWWVADSCGSRIRVHKRRADESAPGRDQGKGHQRERIRADSGDGGALGGMAIAKHERARPGVSPIEGHSRVGRDRPAIDSETRELGNTIEPGLQGYAGDGGNRSEPGRDDSQSTGSTPAPSGAGCMADPERDGGRIDFAERKTQGRVADGRVNPWVDFDLIPCRDGKTRRVESGTFPLAYGIPERVGRLRGYGNAIVPQVAAAFIKAYLEARES